MGRLNSELLIVGCAAFAYLAGSVNLTIAAARALHIKGIQKTGSKNPGITNLFRIAGAETAGIVLVLELAKAYLAFLPARFFVSPDMLYVFILPFLIGNLFPVFHRFQGGKGVAAAVGALLAVDFRVMLLGGAIFIAMFALFRRVSVGSLSMALSYPVFIFVFHGQGMFLYAGIALTAILFATHRRNIKRLAQGKEPRLTRNR